jgi:L-alanine-DL-glutamate epimerase-like enolase superfamily enzyme
MRNEMKIDKGFAYPFDAPGLGIDWDWKTIEKMRVAPPAVVESRISNVTRRK